MNRFLLQYSEIRNKNVVFTPEQSKKIRKVLRLKPKDKVIAFDNKGWEYLVELEKIRNQETVGKIIDQTLNERKTNITLYQALPKSLKVEYIIQKCTELGIDNIVFFESEFSQVKSELINDKKITRWRKIANEASEQCGRVFVPEVVLHKEGLNNILEKIKFTENNFDKTIFLDKEGKYINDEKFINLDYDNVNFFVGPEGGFSPTETKIFESFKIRSVKISKNILRSETSGVVLLSQIQFKIDN